MTDIAETTRPVSLALLNFAGTLARRDPDRFGSEAAILSDLGRSRQSEDAIIFRLTDQAVRVWGAALLELRDRKHDADTLRALPPIHDRETSEAATALLDAFDSALLSHSKDCAACAAGGAGTPEFVGCQAAYAAIALANSSDELKKQAIYGSAANLLAELRGDARAERSGAQ